MKPMTTPSDEAGGGLRYRRAPPAAPTPKISTTPTDANRSSQDGFGL
jgi:hypothetical protein